MFLSVETAGLASISERSGCHVPRTPVAAAFSQGTACLDQMVQYAPPNVVLIDSLDGECGRALTSAGSLAMLPAACPNTMLDMQGIQVSQPADGYLIIGTQLGHDPMMLRVTIMSNGGT